MLTIDMLRKERNGIIVVQLKPQKAEREWETKVGRKYKGNIENSNQY